MLQKGKVWMITCALPCFTVIIKMRCKFCHMVCIHKHWVFVQITCFLCGETCSAITALILCLISDSIPQYNRVYIIIIKHLNVWHWIVRRVQKYTALYNAASVDDKYSQLFLAQMPVKNSCTKSKLMHSWHQFCVQILTRCTFHNLSKQIIYIDS